MTHIESPANIDATVNSRGYITRHRLPAVLDWERTHGRCVCVDRSIGVGFAGIALGSFFLMCHVILFVLNPKFLTTSYGILAIVVTIGLLASGVVHPLGRYYCSITGSELTLGRKTLLERWTVASHIKAAIVRIRAGSLYVGDRSSRYWWPKPGYFVVTVECAGRWMVVGVTRTEGEARQYASRLGTYGIPVELETRGVFSGPANL